MENNFTYTATRVKKFGHAPVVEVDCFDKVEKQKTECLLIFDRGNGVTIYGADHLHPLVKAEVKNTAFEALTVGEIEAEELISELESSKLGRAIRAKRFHEAMTWME